MVRPLNSESITNMLSNFFGYIERYQVIRPDRVRQAVEDECADETIERQCGSRVAAELGAQYQVTGTVTPVRGDSVMIVAYLTDELEGRSIPPVSVRGSQDNGYTLLNELYQELASASATEGERVVANAALPHAARWHPLGRTVSGWPYGDRHPARGRRSTFPKESAGCRG